MHLIQILLPTADNVGHPFPHSLFTTLCHDLTERFGGVTIYARGPAEDFWDSEDGPSRDDIVILEIMSEDLDVLWWRDKCRSLEREFRQDEVVIREQEFQRL